MSTGTVTRRDVLRGAGAVGAGAALAATAPLATPPAHADHGRGRQPNVVVVFIDDMGYGDLGCYGAPLVKTPVLDGMARRGLRFTEFYSGSPTCTPSRAALLTGCYAPRVNLPLVLQPTHTNGLSTRESTMPEYFRRSGYATGMVGKWHLGNPRINPEHHPLRHGFDSFFGIPYSNDMNPLPLYDGYTVVEEPPDQASLTRRFSEKAVEFVRAHADEPFFLYLAHPQPHEPLAAEAKNRSAGGEHGDSVEEIDRYVGVLLDTLTELGIRDDTCVVFTSDNGPWYVGSPGDHNGRKVETYEGGMKVPCIVEWPRVVPAGQTYRRPAINLDLLPTLLEAIGAEPDPERPFDGRSLLPALRRGERVDRGDIYYYDDVAPAGNLNCVRRGDWKLHVRRVNGPYFTGKAYDSTEELPQLFDLRRDPGEHYDLGEHHPEIVAELQAAIADFDRDVRADRARRYTTLTVELAGAVGGQLEDSGVLEPVLREPTGGTAGNRVQRVRVDGADVPLTRPLDLVTLDLGQHTLEVVAVDTAGTSTTLTRTFEVIATFASVRALVERYTASGAITAATSGGLLDRLERARRHHHLGRVPSAVAMLEQLAARVQNQVRSREVRALLVRDARALVDTVDRPRR